MLPPFRAESTVPVHQPVLIHRRGPRQLFIALFLFFYLPIAFYYGWALLPTAGIDFPSYYHAARLAFVKGRTPYGFAAFFGIPADPGRTVQPFIYPPPSLLAFWPLANLSLVNARAVFLLVSHLCYIGSIWIILFQLTPLPRDRRLREITLILSLIYLLCFDPAVANLGLGQVNLIVLFFICLALAALKKNAPAWRIALPLSIAILLKTYPVLLFLLLFFRRKFRAIVLTCAALACLTGVSALVLPQRVWHSWYVEVLPLGGYANTRIPAAYAWNQSINGFVMRLLVRNDFSPAPLLLPSLAAPAATLLALAAVAVTGFVSFRRQANEAAETSAYLLMIFLVAPLSWDHHLVYVLPAAALSIALLVEGRTSRVTAAALVAALALMAWRIPLDHPSLMSGWWTLWISIKLYAVVFLWLFFICRAAGRAPPAPDTHPRPTPICPD